jgi:hypothetical protein
VKKSSPFFLDGAPKTLQRIESESGGVLQINDEQELARSCVLVRVLKLTILQKNGLPNTFDSAETIMTSSSAYSIRRPRGVVSVLLSIHPFFTSLPLLSKSFYNLPNNHIVVQGPSIESDAESEVRRP